MVVEEGFNKGLIEMVSMSNKPCRKTTKSIIKIGYLKNNKAQFISNIVVTDNLLNLLTNFVQVVKISVNPNNFDMQELKRLNIDYLLVDIKEFGIRQFILREKHQVNIPFIIMLHAIYHWFSPLIYIIPLIRKEDIIIAPSEYTKKTFLRISKQLKIYVIPHCLDILKIQKNISSRFKKHRKEIGFLGRLSEDKGIETLIDCIPEIISRVGDVHLNIIGPLSGGDIKDHPPSLFVKKLEKKVKKLKLTNNITFRGMQLGLNKYKILSQLDVFVSPSTEGETFCLTNLEALTCGIPVVTSDWEASRELIREGENGYLIKVAPSKNGSHILDKKQMISSVIRILQDEELALKMKGKARKIALHYDFRNIMPRLIRLLKKKYIKTNKNNRWKFLRNKRILDFKDCYQKEILFFIYISGIGNKTYLDIYNEMQNSIKSPSMFKTYPKKNRYIKGVNKKMVRSIRQELFRYLCIQ